MVFARLVPKAAWSAARFFAAATTEIDVFKHGKRQFFRMLEMDRAVREETFGWAVANIIGCPIDIGITGRIVKCRNHPSSAGTGAHQRCVQ